MDELVKNILIKLENVGKIARITYFLLFLGSSIALFILAFTYLASKEAFAVALIGNASFVAGMTFIVWLLMVAERGKEIADNDRVSQIIDELQSSMPKQEGIFIAKKGRYSDYKNLVFIEHGEKLLSIGLHIDPKTKDIIDIYIYVEDGALKSRIAERFKNKGYELTPNKRDLILKIEEKDNEEIVAGIKNCIEVIKEIK